MEWGGGGGGEEGEDWEWVCKPQVRMCSEIGRITVFTSVCMYV